ncbi:MAG: hypothetical protein U1F57_02060 [bacterium]
MADIIFDAFDADAACYNPPPSNPQQADPCTVSATFHLRGEKTPATPVITFRRSQDHFVLETYGSEATLGLLHSAGFSENDSNLKSSLNYSILLGRWMSSSYPDFVKYHKYQGSSLLPLAQKTKNFILAGSIDKADATQVSQSADLLKQILALPKESRVYFSEMLDVLKKDRTQVFRSEMEPRIHWLYDLLQNYEEMESGLPKATAEDGLRNSIESWFQSLYAYLGAGESKETEFGLKPDLWIPDLSARKDYPDKIKNFYDFPLPYLRKLADVKFFKTSKEAQERLDRVNALLKNAVREHRADLLVLDPKKAFERSIEFRITGAASGPGSMEDLVSEESKSAHLDVSWFSKPDQVAEVAQAIAPAFRWTGNPDQPGHAELNAAALSEKVEKLLSSHTIETREFAMGTLAALRFVFGKKFEAANLSAWTGKGYQSIPLTLSADDRKTLSALDSKLSKTLSQKKKRDSLILSLDSLPWAEGGACFGGFATGGGGILEESRPFTVGGFTAGGIGCGALLGHSLHLTKNRYVSDAVGGVLLGAAGFALSLLLTRNFSSGGTDAKNPVTGYGP